jgi:hypothetical protein
MGQLPLRLPITTIQRCEPDRISTLIGNAPVGTLLTVNVVERCWYRIQDGRRLPFSRDTCGLAPLSRVAPANSCGNGKLNPLPTIASGTDTDTWPAAASVAVWTNETVI